MIDRPRRIAWLLITATLALLTTSLPAAVDDLVAALAVPLGLVQAGSILLAAVRPRAAIIVHLGALSAIAACTTSTAYPWPVSVISMIALAALIVSLSLSASLRLVLVAWAGAMMIMVTVIAAALLLDQAPAQWPLSMIVAGATSAGTLGVTAVVIQLRDARRRLREVQTEHATSQIELTGAQERTRIAREMHDVVAHSMSLVHMRASSARYRVGAIDDEIIAEFEIIATQSRAALSEMRSLLSVLRSDDPASLAPQPGLAELRQLIDATRDAGIPIEATIAVIVPAPAAAVQLAFYRVAQEALSNVVRHASGASTSVVLTQDEERLLLRVYNSSTTAVTTSPVAGGHGIQGMIERMASVRGTLVHGPEDGGYCVSATAPLSLNDPL